VNKYFELNINNYNLIVITNNNKVISLDISNKKPNLIYEDNKELIKLVETELTNYFNKTNKTLNFPYELNVTDFQLKVYNELLKIPYGETKTYEDIAISLGDKKKVRAVGNAVSKNPLLIKIPCHRIVRKDGSLGGFSSGINNKIKLLNIEDNYQYKTWVFSSFFIFIYCVVICKFILYNTYEQLIIWKDIDMNKILESKVSKLFKTLSDPTRIKILYLLNDKALTVTEIHTKLNMSQTAVSHQLKVLRDINLVKAKRDGKNIYYSLADSHVYEIFNQAIEHVSEDECNE